MGKKMKFPSLFKSPDSAATTTATTSWRWPSCKNPETLSFRAATTPGAADIFKTMNSAYDTEEELEDPGGGEEVEAVISGLRAAKRLFFEPGETSSIMTESRGGEDKYCSTMFVNKKNEDDENERHFGPLKESSGGVVGAMDFFEEGESSSTMADSRGGEDKYCLTSSKFDEDNEEDEEEGECGGHFGQMRESRRSVAVAMDSMDPYGDFKRSMEEMVEAHGLRDFEGLQELLGWYLKANGKESHGYVVGAFVDLLVGLAFDSSSSSCDDDDHDDHDHDQDQCFSMISSSIACSLNSPLSFSSSINTSSSTSTSTPCLSSLEAEDEIVKTVDSAC